MFSMKTSSLTDFPVLSTNVEIMLGHFRFTNSWNLKWFGILDAWMLKIVYISVDIYTAL